MGAHVAYTWLTPFLLRALVRSCIWPRPTTYQSLSIVTCICWMRLISLLRTSLQL